MGNENYIAVIGPQRSGTSWLYRYLRAHPEVFAPAIKEVNWFNIATGKSNPQQIANVKRLYEKARDQRAAQGLDLDDAGQQRKERFEMQSDADLKTFFQNRADETAPYVDVSPGYSFLDQAGFARIAATFSNAKLVMLLRNPADRAWSVVNHLRRRHAPDAQIADVIDQIARLDPQQTTHRLRQIYDTARTVFPADRILCLYTEDMFDAGTKQTTLDKLSAFAHVPSHPVGDFDFTGNLGSYDPMPADFRRSATIDGQPDMRWARDHMGYVPDAWNQDACTTLTDWQT